MKTNKKIYEDRVAFRFLLAKALHSEVFARSRQRGISMTAYMTRALVRQVQEDRKYD